MTTKLFRAGLALVAATAIGCGSVGSKKADGGGGASGQGGGAGADAGRDVAGNTGTGGNGTGGGGTGGGGLGGAGGGGSPDAQPGPGTWNVSFWNQATFGN